MHRILTIFFLVTLPGGAAIHDTDSTPTSAEVQALHDSASAGDTINIASGSFDWTGSVTITKGLTIRGGGPGLTTLTKSGGGTLFSIRSSNVSLGFFKVEMAANTIYAINFNGLSMDLSGVRITNIHFDHSSHRGRDIFSNYNAPYNVACLVDHCRFDWSQASDEPVFVHGPNTAWDSIAPFGSGDVVIVEDCTIKGGGGYTDFNNYATGVVRYCTIEDNKLDWHGAASNSLRGCRSAEIYGNTWVGTGNSSRIQVRGGAAIIWGNTNTHHINGSLQLYEYGKNTPFWSAFQADYTGVSNNGGNTQFSGLPAGWVSKNIKVGKGVEHIGDSDNGNYSAFDYLDHVVTAKGTTGFTIDLAYAGDDSGTFGQYQTPDQRPLQDQTGVGVNQLNGEEPAYVFGNRRAGAVQWEWGVVAAPSEAEDFHGSAFDDKDMIVPDEDVFEEVSSFDGATGCGIGTKDEMEAIIPTTVGVGFWVTDEGSWHAEEPGTSGQLYKWNGSSWELYYTPYHYPHPLNDGVSEFPPSAPISLSISAK